ncbi:MAG: hypothetical protein A2W05_06110 [Candidatus Schekmanbacteria bacterium RBG_16_38_10]|uniref:Methyltransferase domain-containing protein n=1 Tax=Candidatus Schekmanbacteria bacterium RBG_16_38_10 TaxID=1817879 RepID=A0A1F7RYD1_9BACT|nr:MAG: hypothetical protein A2W05_06110 [Candidatus Schekmanbacteria bacterium RBG_16_38_10]
MQQAVRKLKILKKHTYSAFNKYQSRKVAASYDERFRGCFGQLKHWNTKRVLAKALSMIGSDTTVLDLACGTGRFIPILERKTRYWFGADISHEMLQVSQTKIKNTQLSRGFVRLNAEKLPFKSNSFSCIMSVRFIHHIPYPNLQNILHELHRVTKDWLVIEWKVSNSLNASIRHTIGGRVKPASRCEEVRKIFHKAGFRVAAMLPVNRVFSNAVIFIARKSFVLVREQRFPAKRKPVVYQEQPFAQSFNERGAEAGLLFASLDNMDVK